MKPWQQEKHYVQSLILNAVAKYPLVFKGDTYLWFFHGLRRFSEDLDFTGIGDSSGIAEDVSKALSLYGVENETKIVSDNEKGLSFKVLADGPLYTDINNRCVVYVEISKREGIIEKPIAEKLDIAEYQLPIKILNGMSLDEVAAEKVRAVMSREKARDVYDLYYLIKEKKVDFRIDIIREKLNYISKSFSKKDFIACMEKKRAFFDKELKSILFEHVPSFDEASHYITSWVPELKS